MSEEPSKTVIQTTQAAPLDDDNGSAPQKRRSLIWAILIGIALIPFNLKWLYWVEHVDYTNTPTTSALFFNAIFVLLVLMGVNSLIARLAPRLKLSRGEILTIYAMVNVACAIAAMDQLALLLVTLQVGPGRMTAENGWATTIMPSMPLHLLPKAGPAVTDLYKGGSTLYTAAHVKGWLGPTLWWSAFAVTFMWVCLCMTAIFRKQWDAERLTYPMAEIPLRISDPKAKIFHSRLFWIACSIGATVRIWNLIALMKPSLPALPVQVVAFTLGNDMPWAAAGPIPTCFFPFAIGMCFFLPTNISFSVLFFQVFVKLQEIFFATLGHLEFWGPPYYMEQGGGAAVGLGISVLWLARGHLRSVFRCAVGKEKMDDSTEPLSYKTAFWGFVIGSILMIAFAVHAGLRLPVALIYFAIFLLFVIVTARLRAEVGLPTIDIWMVGSDNILRTVGGDASFTKPELSVFTLFFWLTRAHRQLPMPIQADTMRFGNRTGMDLRKVSVALMIAAVVGVIGAFWIYLDTMYRVGYYTGHKAVEVLTFWESQTWVRLNTWIKNPTPPDTGRMGAYAFGAAFTMLLSYLRVRFDWWPLHPAGFIAGTSFSVMRYWLPMLFAATVKALLLKFGGLKAYQTAVPFFIGLIVGEFVVGMLVSILSLWIWFPPNSGIGGL